MAAAESEKVVYREQGRSYLASFALGALVGVGWFVDGVVVGAGGTHAFAWAGAIVLVIGFDLLVTYAARQTRQVTVTASQLRVGDQILGRDEIVGFELDAPDGARIIGRTMSYGMPRGTEPLAVHLTGGSTVIVPTKRPSRLAAALALTLVRPEVRPAEPADLPLLAEIDERSGVLFSVAGFPPFPPAREPSRSPIHVLVAGRPPFAFLRLDEVDGNAHIQQLSVLPANMRQGHGTALVNAACAWAEAEKFRAVTLITFRDVGWNAPFYAKLGFVPISDLSPGLLALRSWERIDGLDALGPRIAMRKSLVGSWE